MLQRYRSSSFGSILIAFLITIFTLSACGGMLVAHAVLPAFGPSNTALSPPPLPEIPEIVSQNNVASLSLQAAFNAQGRPAFFWNGHEGAPTIRVLPGDTIHLHFMNELPAFCAVGVESDANLHFHGLTLSPNKPGDEVITSNAAPGSAIDYTIVINTDQPPGLYWYHPHPHGITAWEAGNGMAGALIVDGIANELPSIAGLREHVIILSDPPNGSSLAIAEASVMRRTQQTSDAGQGGCGPEINGTPTINGQHLVSIGIQPGETQLFRVLNASNHRHFDLAIDGQQLTLVAQDGVPIQDYPGAPQSIIVSDIVIPPAGRAEFLVTGSQQPTSLISQCYQTGPAGYPNPTIVLAMLRSDRSQPQMTSRVPKAHGVRHSQFYRVQLPPPAAQHTITFQENGNGFTLNGVLYDPAAPPNIIAHAGTVEEWTLENASDETHVFHIHQVHFIVESINGIARSNPHWLDTVDVPPQQDTGANPPTPSLMKVLIDFRDPTIRGTFLYHCHILSHEDGGMMAKIQVI